MRPDHPSTASAIARLGLLAALEVLSGTAQAQRGDQPVSERPSDAPARPADRPQRPTAQRPLQATPAVDQSDGPATAPPRASRQIARPAHARPANRPAGALGRPPGVGSFTNPANRDQTVLVPIASGTTDVSPVSTSLRALPVDLRAPQRFDRIFAVRNAAPGDLRGGTILNFGGSNVAASSAPLDAGNAEWFARVDGGIVALFPRSAYVQTPGGTIAEVPAGTIYAIGAPPRGMFASDTAPTETEPSQEPTDVPMRPEIVPQQLSANRSEPAGLIPADEASGTEGPKLVPPSIMNNETYRSRRLQALLAKAAADSKARDAGNAPPPIE